VSGKVTGWFIRHADRPDDPALWRVLVVMADAADNAGRNIRIAGETIARRSVMSRTHARRLVERAVLDGWLELSDPGGSHRAAMYRFAHYDNSELRAAQTARTLSSTGPARATIRAAQEGPLRAAALRETASNGFTGNTGLRADPAPDPRAGRAGAGKAPAAAPEGDPVGRAEALRRMRAALAAGCDRCDDYGWLDHGDGTGEWCDHRPQAAT
jgi:hypothetical protein